MVKRYNIIAADGVLIHSEDPQTEENLNGYWVKCSDYEALEQELEEARNVIEFYGNQELSARLMLAEEDGRRAREWLKKKE